MERIQSLISRLQEELNQGADPSRMLNTVNLLQSELLQYTQTGVKKLGTSKVAVVLPVPSRVETPSFENTKENSSYSSQKPKTKAPGQLDFHFDPMQEIPTLAHQQKKKEQNEMQEDEQSLNDRLREEKTELMHVLKDEPIKDLRKAISINDRFVFIDELFRGDEAMFERSLKTINSFNIYPEAEYWLNRELKVKLGWDDKNETVTSFYRLVKRRFS